MWTMSQKTTNNVTKALGQSQRKCVKIVRLRHRCVIADPERKYLRVLDRMPISFFSRPLHNARPTSPLGLIQI